MKNLYDKLDPIRELELATHPDDAVIWLLQHNYLLDKLTIGEAYIVYCYFYSGVLDYQKLNELFIHE